MIYWKGAVELWRYVSSFSIIGICLKLFGCGDDMLIICNEGLILFLRDIWIISEIRWIFHLVIGQQKIHLLVRFFLFHGKSIKEVICIWKHFFFTVIPDDQVFYIIGSCPGLVWSLLAGVWGGGVWRENAGLLYVQKHFLCSSLRYVCTWCVPHTQI